MAKIKKLGLVLSLIAVILFTGCSGNDTSSNAEYGEEVHFYPVGVVEHNDSLKEAENNCYNSCKIKYSVKVKRGAIPTPRLSQCTNKECYCEC